MAGLIPDGSAAADLSCGGRKDERETYVPARWDQRANQLVSPIPGGGYPEEDDPDRPEEGHEDDSGDFEQAGPVWLSRSDSEAFPSVANDCRRLTEAVEDIENTRIGLRGFMTAGLTDVGPHVLDQFLANARREVYCRDAKPRQVAVDQLVRM